MDGSEVIHRLWNRDLAAVLNFRHILNNLRYYGTIPLRFTRVIRIGCIRRQAEEDFQEGRRPTQATAGTPTPVHVHVPVSGSPTLPSTHNSYQIFELAPLSNSKIELISAYFLYYNK
ncbi:hypothetical protein PHYBLDRAFT_139007 [Phycomyces blakesleeanus NRRL 1555(-)]|uniref:Uncharacterized protein n=1 Tax=Phycomyces blakesleeanus (strain ATCC 8743b / DSM 1359 / FGSC 10004 / NBRC 33097 / NRRL 1555) TaxID=763407 RepID=A0A162YL55_PHYB8|nr:hypothetical protein PHYBLDRAFT_139007 [Phycomyces blakesleeanus NRRL 1555(-)]OAD81455.1 hypothetical protein PHYBLDRAFT_139007 [Phycomyces blakesleeanus NRRL 1555(-)]|eukprot:XP_018299495.1 hypothetical protein PHYBLDRAFT_139007 [Phycomyces blakesleeanus NRRL 1555(-)]